MTYRDELGAARARLQALQEEAARDESEHAAEVEALNEEIARLKGQAGPPRETEAVDVERFAHERRRLSRLAVIFFAMSLPCISFLVWFATQPADPDAPPFEHEIRLWSGLLIMGGLIAMLLVGSVWCVVSVSRQERELSGD